MTVSHDLLACVERVAGRLALPAVRALHVPEPRENPGMESEFGLVVLEDGSAGFFFALLGDTLQRLHAGVCSEGPEGRSPLLLARGIEDDDAVECAVALGAISAITQHVFKIAGYAPPAAANSLGGGEFSAADHVGMVGLFPSLSKRLRAQGIALTVLELRADKVQRDGNFEVTLDPTALRDCNHILCTASTLINGTLDTVLGHVTGAGHVALIGPSASCFPDPLFARGIHVVGGATVLDAGELAVRLANGKPWGDSVRRYAIDAADYPGLDTLLK
jgi:uncharacterized protein (DUF4213/DUF364 family)